ncbi:hypothetical protein [Pseudomonas yamanorum]|uniref:hypothetical protein n=1 Tax=Pseudomonas yamanorum TaxID=515393 RepID=UPI003B9F963B
MPYVVIPQPFPKSPLQTQFDTEDEANARAQAMIEQAPQQAVYVAELKTLYQGQVSQSYTTRLSQLWPVAVDSTLEKE